MGVEPWPWPWLAFSALFIITKVDLAKAVTNSEDFQLSTKSKDYFKRYFGRYHGDSVSVSLTVVILKHIIEMDGIHGEEKVN